MEFGDDYTSKFKTVIDTIIKIKIKLNIKI